jgi:hypothetical protein
MDIMCVRLDKMIWVAVFQRTLLFASSGGALKRNIVCFFRTLSFPYYFVSVWKDTILNTFMIEKFHEFVGGGTCYGIVVLEV